MPNNTSMKRGSWSTASEGEWPQPISAVKGTGVSFKTILLNLLCYSPLAKAWIYQGLDLRRMILLMCFIFTSVYDITIIIPLSRIKHIFSWPAFEKMSSHIHPLPFILSSLIWGEKVWLYGLRTLEDWLFTVQNNWSTFLGRLHKSRVPVSWGLWHLNLAAKEEGSGWWKKSVTRVTIMTRGARNMHDMFWDDAKLGFSHSNSPKRQRCIVIHTPFHIWKLRYV